MSDEEKVAEMTRHSALIKKMQALGFPADEEGICFGVAMAGAEATLLGKKERDIFNARLQMIDSIPLDAFENKLAKYAPDLVEDISAFFNKVELLHQAQKHPELFGGGDLHLVSKWPLPSDSDPDRAIPITYPCYVYVQESPSGEGLLYVDANGESSPVAQNAYTKALLLDLYVEEIPYRRLDSAEAEKFGAFSQEATPVRQGLGAASLVRSKMMEERGGRLTQADSFLGVYTLEELEDCFSSLARFSEETTQPLVLKLGGAGHTILVSYDYDEKGQKKWSLLDANKLEKVGEYLEGHREIAKEVLSSLSENDMAVMEIGIMTDGEEPLPPDMVRMKKEFGLHSLLGATQRKLNHGGLNGGSLLYIAAKGGRLEDVRALLERGANPNQGDNAGLTALHIAAQEGHVAIVERLLASGAHLNQEDNDGLSALHIAAQEGHVAIVEHLLASGAAVNQTSKNGFTPLYFAAQNGHLAVLERLLVTKGIDIHTANPPLKIAVQNGHMAVVERLLAQGTDVNRANNQGSTPLYAAVLRGHMAMVSALLDAGADVHSVFRGYTPLHIAKQYKHPDIEKLLDAHIKEQNMLFAAAKEGNKEVIFDALEQHARRVAKQVNPDGDTLLHIAVQKGHLEMVDALLRAGASVSQAGNKGATPLFIAVQEGRPKMLALVRKFAFLEAGHQGTALLTRKFMLIEKLNSYLRDEAVQRKPNRSAFFCVSAPPAPLSAETAQAANALLLALTEKKVDLSTLQFFQKTLTADKTLREIYESARDVFPLSDAAKKVGTKKETSEPAMESPRGPVRSS